MCIRDSRYAISIPWGSCYDIHPFHPTRCSKRLCNHSSPSLLHVCHDVPANRDHRRIHCNPLHRTKRPPSLYCRKDRKYVRYLLRPILGAEERSLGCPMYGLYGKMVKYVCKIYRNIYHIRHGKILSCKKHFCGKQNPI